MIFNQEAIQHLRHHWDHLEILVAGAALAKGWKGQEREREEVAEDQKAFSSPPPPFLPSLSLQTLPP